VATTTNPNTSNRALVPRAINSDDPGPPGSRMRHLARLALAGTMRHLVRLALPPAVCATLALAASRMRHLARLYPWPQPNHGPGTCSKVEAAGRVEGWRIGQRPVPGIRQAGAKVGA
jgi:hypothetical protein